MLVLAVTWVAKEGKEKDVAQLFRDLTAASRKEPGCLGYTVHLHNERPREFFLYEVYKDQAALDAHRAAPHFQQIARGPLMQMADRKQGDLYTPLE
jgi:quinol monooxygenase YgiN